VKIRPAVRRALAKRGDFEAQRVLLALLLQPPAARQPHRGRQWSPPPLLSSAHSHDAPGVLAWRSAVVAAHP
jgi:hypothetical protein